MKLKFLKYIYLAAALFVVAGCETYSDQEVEYSPIFPISGEWMTHVYNADGVTPASASLFALRTYNTSSNASDKAWFRIGSTQAYAVMGVTTVDPKGLTIAGSGITNSFKSGQSFTIVEGKIMLKAQALPSGAVADSIYVKYTTTFNGNTYVVKGHRRTGWTSTE